MKVLFMGTPDFAVPTLRALVEGGYDVIGAVTQPDKPKGRGHHLMPPPVKEFALGKNIPVYQPATLKAQPKIPPFGFAGYVGSYEVHFAYPFLL